MSVQIDSHVPAPGAASGRPRKYPWLELEVGQSFLFPQFITSGGAAAAMSYASKTYGLKFTVRKTPEGYRCWRIA